MELMQIWTSLCLLIGQIVGNVFTFRLTSVHALPPLASPYHTRFACTQAPRRRCHPTYLQNIQMSVFFKNGRTSDAMSGTSSAIRRSIGVPQASQGESRRYAGTS